MEGLIWQYQHVFIVLGRLLNRTSNDGAGRLSRDVVETLASIGIPRQLLRRPESGWHPSKLNNSSNLCSSSLHIATNHDDGPSQMILVLGNIN